MFNKNDILKGLYNYKIDENHGYTKCIKNQCTGKFIPLYDISDYNIELFERKQEFDDILDCITITETLKNDNTLEYINNIDKYITSYNYLFINQKLLSNIMYKGEFSQEILYKFGIGNNKACIETYLLPKEHYGAYLIKLNKDNEIENYIKIG